MRSANTLEFEDTFLHILNCNSTTKTKKNYKKNQIAALLSKVLYLSLQSQLEDIEKI